MNSASTFTQKFQCSKKPKPSGVMASVFLLDASVGSYMGQYAYDQFFHPASAFRFCII